MQILAHKNSKNPNKSALFSDKAAIGAPNGRSEVPSM
jgi:hypothetical protein